MPELAPFLQQALLAAPAALAIVLGTVGLNMLVSRGLSLLATKTSFGQQDLTPLGKVVR